MSINTLALISTNNRTAVPLCCIWGHSSLSPIFVTPLLPFYASTGCWRKPLFLFSLPPCCRSKGNKSNNFTLEKWRFFCSLTHSGQFSNINPKLSKLFLPTCLIHILDDICKCSYVTCPLLY